MDIVALRRRSWVHSFLVFISSEPVLVLLISGKWAV